MPGTDIHVQKMRLSVLNKKTVSSEQETAVKKQKTSMQLFKIFRKYMEIDRP